MLGNTQMTAIQLIELAARRAKLNPETLTGEQLEVAALDLYLTVTQLSTVGLQLWVVEGVTISLEEGRGTYLLSVPGYVEELKEVVLRRLTDTDTLSADAVTTTLTSALYDAAQMQSVGVEFTATPAGVAHLELFDGTAWQSVSDDTRMSDTVQWFVPHKLFSSTRARIVWTTGTAAAGDIVVSTSVNDRPLQAMSRDEWAQQPRKLQTGGQPTLWYLERHTQPKLNLFPAPQSDTDHLLVWWRRRMEDVGALSNLLEIPPRWYDPIVTELSVRLGTDISGADEVRLQTNVAAAGARTTMAAGAETDSGCVRLNYALSGYTR
jgi:hypothetical protein